MRESLRCRLNMFTLHTSENSPPKGVAEPNGADVPKPVVVLPKIDGWLAAELAAPKFPNAEAVVGALNGLLAAAGAVTVPNNDGWLAAAAPNAGAVVAPKAGAEAGAAKGFAGTVVPKPVAAGCVVPPKPPNGVGAAAGAPKPPAAAVDGAAFWFFTPS